MTKSELSNFYKLTYATPALGDIHYEEGVVADLKFDGGFDTINLDRLSGLGASHVLIDLDGTLIPGKNKFHLPETHRVKLTDIYNDPRFDSVSIATENGSRPYGLVKSLGVGAIDIYSSYYDLGDEEPLEVRRWKHSPEFWDYILKNLGMMGSPGNVVMIGDSPVRDIKPAKEKGLKTVQVDRIEMTPRSYKELSQM